MHVSRDAEIIMNKIMRPKRFQEGYRTGHLYARALDLDSMNPDPDTDQHFK
jgi:hypothetical protein